MSFLNLCFISDTHSQHDLLNLGSGDLLFHCGDFSRRGGLDEIRDFAAFMARQDFRHKIVIAGNHDWSFEDDRRDKAEALFTEEGLIYLNDSGVTIDGLNIWGSPVQPEFRNWAFNRQRGEDIRKHWRLIPEDTHVLLTHGPPIGIMDRCSNGDLAGCPDLLATVRRIKPRIHAFGHIHEGYGVQDHGSTLFINACNLNLKYQMANQPLWVNAELIDDELSISIQPS